MSHEAEIQTHLHLPAKFRPTHWLVAVAGSIPLFKALVCNSPNEKLNPAAVGAGGQPFGDLRLRTRAL